MTAIIISFNKLKKRLNKSNFLDFFKRTSILCLRKHNMLIDGDLSGDHFS